MPMFGLLTTRLLIATCSCLVLLSLALLLVTDREVRIILDQSQTAVYQRRIDEIINHLQLQEEKLQATGLPDNYRDDFQTSTIRNLRGTYYLRGEYTNTPLIFTLEGRVVMHPSLNPNQMLNEKEWDLKRVRARKNGQFVQASGSSGRNWYIFKYFEPWGWVVGYSLPLSLKYADANRLLRYLGITLTLILLPFAAALSLFISRQLKPIGVLTEAAQRMGDGDLSSPSPTKASGELGVLTQSFERMRTLIKTELDKRSHRVERGRRQQQALILLSHNNFESDQDLQPFLRLATEQLGRILACRKVGVWLLDDAAETLHCRDLYLLGKGHQSEFAPQPLAEVPELAATLSATGPVVRDASGAAALQKNLDDPGAFASLNGTCLEIPVRVAGEPRALVRIEHEGENRIWYEDEILFVSQITDQISQSIDRADRRTAALEIARLRNELASIVDSMPSILIGIDCDLLVRHWNQEAEKLIGMSERAVLGRPVVDCLPLLAKHQVMINHALTESRIQTRRKLSWHLNGHNIFCDLTIYPLLDGEIPGAVIRIDDVSERVRLEEMMIQTEKMLSVGGLAAGMAHEINNPLAGILQSIQVIRNRLDRKFSRNAEVAEACGTDIDRISAYIEQRGLLPMFDALNESGNRAAAIIENMLSFSRQSESRQAPHHIGDLIERTIELASNDYDLKRNYDFRKIEIVREDEQELPFVPCSATEIQQVLLSLLKNSAQAMFEDPGCDHPRLILRTRKEGKFVRIEVEDNGPGIPENIRRRIFEPFFTTKGVGIGTGLGLSVSYFIVREKHRGSMEVLSRADKGTCFVIRLPLVAPEEIAQ